MPPRSDLRLLVLHGLRVKGLATADRLDAGPASSDEVERCLKELEQDDLVRHRDGRVTGWSLSAGGRADHDRLVAEELGRSGVRAAVLDHYERFAALNHGFLGLCTAWQLDPGPTPETIEALREVHTQARPIVDALAATLERFAVYGPRLDHALAKVRAGESEWFTKPVIDSYHTVWFELHEDLLSTLGISRGAEGVQRAE